MPPQGVAKKQGGKQKASKSKQKKSGRAKKKGKSGAGEAGKPLDEAKAAGDLLKKLFPGTKKVEQQPQKKPAQQRPPPKPELPPPDPPLDETGRAAKTLGGEAGEKADESLEVKPERLPVHGSLSLRYRGRSSHEDTDHDVIAVLGVDVGDTGRHPVTAHLLVRVNSDLDGAEQTSVLNGIDETYDSDITARLYDAYLDVHTFEALSVLRLGRQTTYDTPEPAFFDGLRLETAEATPLKLWAGGHVGVPVHLHESSSDDDFVTGATLGLSPWPGGRARADWMHVEDARAGVFHDNDLLALSAWQNVGDSTRLHGKYSWLEGRSRDLLLRVDSSVTDADLQLQASYFELLTTQRALALEFDPYSESAFDYSPYRQLKGLASKGLGDHIVLTGGLDMRRLVDSRDEKKFNREFERYYLTSSVYDLRGDSLSFDVTGEWWNSRGGEDILALDAEVRSDLGSGTSARVGTGYWLYKFDFGTNREQERVRSYYAGFTYRPSKTLRLDLEYSFEDDESDDYHVLEALMSWSF